MSKMIVNHRTADFDSWKSAYDSMEPVRQKYGSTGSKVFRGVSDPNDLVIITHWGNPEQARRYSESPELREALQRGQVNNDSKFYVVE